MSHGKAAVKKKKERRRLSFDYFFGSKGERRKELGKEEEEIHFKYELVDWPEKN